MAGFGAGVAFALPVVNSRGATTGVFFFFFFRFRLSLALGVFLGVRLTFLVSGWASRSASSDRARLRGWTRTVGFGPGVVWRVDMKYETSTRVVPGRRCLELCLALVYLAGKLDAIDPES